MSHSSVESYYFGAVFIFCQHSLATTDQRQKGGKLKINCSSGRIGMDTIIWFLSIFHLVLRSTLCSGLRRPASLEAPGYQRAMRGKSPNLQIAAWSSESLVGAVKPHWAHLGVVRMIGEGIKPHYLSKWQHCFPAHPFTHTPWST